MCSLAYCMALATSSPTDWDFAYKVAESADFNIGILSEQSERLTDYQVNAIARQESITMAADTNTEYLLQFLQVLKAKSDD